MYDCRPHIHKLLSSELANISALLRTSAYMQEVITLKKVL